MGCDDGNKKDGFTVPTPELIKGSLGQRLIPTVDRMRDKLTKFGFRPYRVRILRCQSAGPRRGMGPESVIGELELLPTPLVVDMSSLQEVVTPLGINEQGSIQLQKISGRYTEEQLLLLGPDGSQPPPNVTVYYEVEFFRRDGRPAEKRRFVRDSAPTWNPTSVEWMITLVNVNEKRTRDGSPQG